MASKWTEHEDTGMCPVNPKLYVDVYSVNGFKRSCVLASGVNWFTVAWYRLVDGGNDPLEEPPIRQQELVRRIARLEEKVSQLEVQPVDVERAVQTVWENVSEDYKYLTWASKSGWVLFNFYPRLLGEDRWGCNRYEYIGSKQVGFLKCLQELPGFKSAKIWKRPEEWE